MTVAALPSTVSYIEDGASTSFPVPFRFRASGDLIVERVADGTSIVLALGVDYTVSGGATDAGGVVTRAVASSGAQLKISRRTARAQPMVYNANDRFPAKSHEEALDRSILISQELGDQIEEVGDRALLVPVGERVPSLPPAADRAGRAIIGTPDGGFTTALLGDGDDPTLRVDLASATGADQIGLRAPGAGAVTRTAKAKLLESVSVLDYGARADGTTDDSLAFARALAAARNVYMPPGRYFVRDVKVPSGRRLHGAGKSAWQPYTGLNRPEVFLTEVIVDGTDAFDVRRTNCVAMSGFGIASRTGTQSNYGQPPGYQDGSGGVAITGSSRFEMDDVSFFGLEYAVHSHLASPEVPGAGTVSGVETDEDNASGEVTFMPRFGAWQASDCKRVFAFGREASTLYTMQDVFIGPCTIALHCGGIVEAHRPDGIRIENVRFYQCVEHSIVIRASPFVSLIGVTAFETKDHGVILRDCLTVVGAGLLIARSGAYDNFNGTSYPAKTSLQLINCRSVSLTGAIEKPTGQAIEIIGGSGYVLSMAVDTPFWTNGNLNNSLGAIQITQAEGVDINVVFSLIEGSPNVVGVAADFNSALSLSGSQTGDASVGTVRGTHIQRRNGYLFRLATSIDIVSNGTAAIGVIRAFIPAGKRLVTRCVETTSPGVLLEANGQLWNGALATEQGGGQISFANNTLATNSTAQGAWFSIPVSLRNSGGAMTVPAGHETRISAALETVS